HILAASTGRITHTLQEVAEPHVRDINGDGMPDLYHIAGAPGSRLFVVLRGVPASEWQRPVDWRPARDYDGDGVPDFLEITNDRLSAHSGRDGHLLWQTKTQRTVGQLGPLNIDVNGDGTCDVILWEDNANQQTHFEAFSGKDGRRLWAGPDVGQNPG